MTQRRVITWKLHLRSAPERVYDALATDAGRRSFWAESADETDGRIHFAFSDGSALASRVGERERPVRFALEYFGGSRVVFECRPDGLKGTDLCLTETATDEGSLDAENAPGWVSVLLALKAFVDFGVDLRNHDPQRSWTSGYVDN